MLKKSLKLKTEHRETVPSGNKHKSITQVNSNGEGYKLFMISATIVTSRLRLVPVNILGLK